MFLDAFVLAFSHTQYYNFAVQQIADTEIHTVNQFIPNSTTSIGSLPILHSPMIIIHQQMHKDNFSLITLLKDLPYTYFDKLYCHHQSLCICWWMIISYITMHGEYNVKLHSPLNWCSSANVVSRIKYSHEPWETAQHSKRWLKPTLKSPGHTVRIQDNALCKNITLSQAEGKGRIEHLHYGG
jgi:hypothetical protein